jgi:hypothetical protein
MHKGPDSIRLATKDLYANLAAAGYNMEDQLTKFQLFKYTSAGEAYCRIYNYQLTRSSVGCDRLPVHLEGLDWVGDESEASGESKLVVYFNRPVALQHLLYLDYYSQYTVLSLGDAEVDEAVDDGNGKYKPRRGNAFYVDTCAPPNKVRLRNPGSLHVARMYPVAVTQGELYYARLLLTCVPAMSFTDLMSVQWYCVCLLPPRGRGAQLAVRRARVRRGAGIHRAGPGRRHRSCGRYSQHLYDDGGAVGGECAIVQLSMSNFKYMMALDH